LIPSFSIYPDGRYAPDFKIANRTNAYYGILDKGEHIEVGRLLANDSYSAPGKFGRVAPDGTPIVPYAKTGPRQYVRNVSSEEAFRLGLVRYGNYTINMTVYERCTSVYGVPTRCAALTCFKFVVHLRSANPSCLWSSRFSCL
jgi:hypothetical protein